MAVVVGIHELPSVVGLGRIPADAAKLVRGAARGTEMLVPSEVARVRTLHETSVVWGEVIWCSQSSDFGSSALMAGPQNEEW